MNLTPASKRSRITGRVRLRRTPFRAQRGERSEHLGRRTLADDARCARTACGGIEGSTESHPTRRGERGSATILVLALLAIMAVFLTSNQRVLHNLKREVRLVEEKQLKKFQPPTAKPGEAKARP